MARGVRVQVWVPARHVAELDLRRGKMTRAAFLREVVFENRSPELGTPAEQMAALQRIARDFQVAQTHVAIARLEGERKAVLAICRLQQEQELPAAAAKLSERLDAITNAQSGVDADIEPPAKELH